MTVENFTVLEMIAGLLVAIVLVVICDLTRFEDERE